VAGTTHIEAALLGQATTLPGARDPAISARQQGMRPLMQEPGPDPHDGFIAIGQRSKPEDLPDSGGFHPHGQCQIQPRVSEMQWPQRRPERLPEVDLYTPLPGCLERGRLDRIGRRASRFGLNFR
jgi:hypothetical protein